MIEIGDKVFVAVFHPLDKEWVDCPDCLGTLYLRLVYPSGEEVTVGCETCRSGYYVQGKVMRLVSRARVIIRTVEKIVSVKTAKYTEIVYHTSDRGHFQDCNVFGNKELAMQRAIAKETDWNKSQTEKIRRKETPDRIWAWNASYHKNQIKRLEEDITLHRAKLDVADEKAKDE